MSGTGGMPASTILKPWRCNPATSWHPAGVAVIAAGTSIQIDPSGSTPSSASSIRAALRTAIAPPPSTCAESARYSAAMPAVRSASSTVIRIASALPLRPTIGS